MKVYVVVAEQTWDSPTPPERIYGSFAAAKEYWIDQGSKQFQEIWECDEEGCQVVWPKQCMKDAEGNYIYQCPRCKLEYTVRPDIHEAASINLHCEVQACKYAILEPMEEQEQQETPVS